MDVLSLNENEQKLTNMLSLNENELKLSHGCQNVESGILREYVHIFIFDFKCKRIERKKSDHIIAYPYFW